MDARRQLILLLQAGVSLSEASRRMNVTRKTAYKWKARAQQEGLAQLSEHSRAPHTRPRQTAPALEEALLALKERYPAWGAKKLVVLLEREQGCSLSLRTADRLLKRHGKVCPRPAPLAAQPFEREAPQQLLQMDFKGLPLRVPYSVLSLLDDCSRFCLAFAPLANRQASSVLSHLWDVFGVHGLPEALLMDNGDCWGAPGSKAPTAFEAALWRLQIRTLHGRPAHPQTQGKVERFHGTALRELQEQLGQASVSEAQAVYAAFVNRYNWERPHEALGMQVPGALYRVSSRKRPSLWPPASYAPGALTRKVDAQGFISYRGQPVKIGKGLAGEYIELRKEPQGLRVYYCEQAFALLEER